MRDIQYLSFSVWLISLGIIPSKSIHVVANGKISFFFMAEWCYIVCIYHIFIHSSVDGHLGCLHILSNVNNAPWMLGCMYIFELVFFSLFGCMSGYMVFLFLVCSESCMLFSVVSVPIRISYNNVGGFFSSFLSTDVICFLFEDSHSDRCEVISHCGFHLHFSGD